LSALPLVAPLIAVLAGFRASYKAQKAPFLVVFLRHIAYEMRL